MVLEPAFYIEMKMYQLFAGAVPTKDQQAELVANVLLNEWFYM